MTYHPPLSTTQRRGKEVEAKISVSRQGAFLRSGLNVADEIEIFDGAENKLSMKEARGEEFLCSFRTFWYPFDKQVGVITKSENYPFCPRFAEFSFK